MSRSVAKDGMGGVFETRQCDHIGLVHLAALTPIVPDKILYSKGIPIKLQAL